jgi:hypothetical protein
MSSSSWVVVMRSVSTCAFSFVARAALIVNLRSPGFLAFPERKSVRVTVIGLLDPYIFRKDLIGRRTWRGREWRGKPFFGEEHQVSESTSCS